MAHEVETSYDTILASQRLFSIFVASSIELNKAEFTWMMASSWCARWALQSCWSTWQALSIAFCLAIWQQQQQYKAEIAIMYFFEYM